MKDIDFNISDPTIRIDFEIIRDSIIELEENKANISSGSSAPSGGNNNDIYIDTSASRLYVKVAGVWKYVNLT